MSIMPGLSTPDKNFNFTSSASSSLSAIRFTAEEYRQLTCTIAFAMVLCYILGLYEPEEEENEVVWADEEVTTIEVEYVRKYVEEEEVNDEEEYSDSVGEGPGERAWREGLERGPGERA
jgi:hypothetical protein